MPDVSQAFKSNRILAKLSASNLRDLASYLTPVNLKLGVVLNEAGTRAEFAYFPINCMISLVAVLQDGKSAVEVGLIGREGMTEVSIALGINESPARSIVQGKGAAIRIPTADFTEAMKRNHALRAEAHRHAYASYSTAMLVAACNN